MTEHESDLTWTEFRTIVADTFGTQIEHVERDLSFVDDLGADSLDMIQVLMDIEDRYQLAIPEQAVVQFITVGHAFDYVIARIPS